MRTAAIILALLFAEMAVAAPAEDHWGEPTDSGVLNQSLTDARAMIERGDPEAAVSALTPLIQTHPFDADVFNLLGFARRKVGDLDGSGWAYARALELDPDHLGALEYQGELFLILGEPAKAQANLSRLTALCGEGCEEREDLAEAIADWQASPRD